MSFNRLFGATLLTGVMVLCGFATSSKAAFIKMADFEHSPVFGTTWAGTTAPDPVNSSNHVAIGGTFSQSQSSGWLLTALPSSIPDGQTGTIFLRFRRPPGTHGFGVGASRYASANWPTLSGPPQAPVSLLDGSESWTGVQVSTGSPALRVNYDQSTVEAGPMANATWYNLWIILNHDSDTTRLYMTTGDTVPNPSSPLQSAATTSPPFLPATSDFPFRDPTGDPLVTFGLQWTGTPTTYMGYPTAVFVDDIFFDPAGANVSLPVPEPTTGMVLGVSMVGCMCCRRRSGRR